MNEQARRSTPAESSSFSYGPTFRLQLLPTPLRADAVTFGYGAVAYSGTDFHRADVVPSRAHSCRHGQPASRFARMCSVGADLRVRPPAGDHIGSPLQDIHVSLDSSTPCWNDAIKRALR